MTLSDIQPSLWETLPPPVLEPTHSQGFSAHLALRASNMCVHSPGPVASFSMVRFSPRASAKTQAQSVSTYVHLDVLPSAQDPKPENGEAFSPPPSPQHLTPNICKHSCKSGVMAVSLNFLFFFWPCHAAFGILVP